MMQLTHEQWKAYVLKQITDHGGRLSVTRQFHSDSYLDAVAALVSEKKIRCTVGAKSHQSRREYVLG